MHGYGGVFRMSSGGSISLIYSFDGVNGSAPVGPLIQGSDGNLYGTASAGGDANGDGAVFQLTLGGKIKPIHLFSGADGKIGSIDIVQNSGDDQQDQNTPIAPGSGDRRGAHGLC